MTRFITSAALAMALSTGAAVGTATAGDFDGFYLGAYGSGDFSGATNTWGLGAQAGYLYEFAPGAYAGVEADVYYPTGGAPTVFTGSARLGYDFGSPLMLFGQVGLGTDTAGTTLWTVGGGAQYEFTDGVSARIGVDRYQPTGGGAANYVMKAGLSYSF